MKVTWRVGGMNRISDTQFQPDWLSLREPADHAARAPELLREAASLMAPGTRVVDLGSGTGSTARAFAAAGFETMSWRFLDTDEGHLQVAKARHPAADCAMCSVEDVQALPLEDAGLVTTSALLDLMSAAWADALAKRLAAASIPFYAALSFDGRMEWDPGLPADSDIVRAFNRHQRGAKAGQVAMGPDGAVQTAQAFEANGFEVRLADSAWHLGPDDAALQAEFVAGVAVAATEAGETQAESWAEARLRTVNHTALKVGHRDLLAIPDGTPAQTLREPRR